MLKRIVSKQCEALKKLMKEKKCVMTTFNKVNKNTFTITFETSYSITNNEIDMVVRNNSAKTLDEIERTIGEI
jgi:hypothetical protein